MWYFSPLITAIRTARATTSTFEKCLFVGEIRIGLRKERNSSTIKLAVLSSRNSDFMRALMHATKSHGHVTLFSTAFPSRTGVVIA